LRLVAEGYTNREVARALVIGAGTVKRHLDHVFDKLGVSSRTAAAATAIRSGLLSREERSPDRIGPWLDR
jgi:DNA-binding NarL/FixJ family response regulator